MSAQLNLRLTLGATIAGTIAILLVNWHVDPFRLRNADMEIRLPDGYDVTESAPFWRKSLAVTSLKPATVILGTSRAESALDSAHPGFADDVRPVYNFALPGANIAQIRQLLVHAQHSRPLRMAIIGLDMEAFLPGGRTDFDPSVLAGNRESAPEWMNRLRFNLSWSALSASARRLRPAQAAPLVEEADVGVRVAFQVGELLTFRSRLRELFPRWSLRDRWDTDPHRAASMQAFRDLLSYARRQGIDLHLFISPVHARYLELYRRVLWWPLFESWKRALVATLAEEAGEETGRKAFPLWDFSGFNAITMEMPPPDDDLTTGMRWYSDSSHYSREHGDLVLDRVLNRPRHLDDAYLVGVPLTAKNVEISLERIRRDADDYRAMHPAEIAELGIIAQLLRRFASKTSAPKASR